MTMANDEANVEAVGRAAIGRMMGTLSIELSGKRALVTGGSRGIGRATSRLLAQAGAEVGIAYHKDHQAAESVVNEIQGSGGRAWAEAADLGTSDGVVQLFERCDREFDDLDIFVANAGIWSPRYVPLIELEHSAWEKMIRTNLSSVFLTAREAARRLTQGGAIVVLSSTAGQRGEAGHSDYAATKGALISFVKSLAVELAPRDVRVNAIAPGWVDTDMAGPALAGDTKDEILAQIPLGRVARASDIAGPIVFLCSELARHVTGEVLNVNGGSVLCG